MVEALYPAASIHWGPEIDQDTVIGTVEDFAPPFPVSTAIKEPVSRIPVMTLTREAARVLFHGYFARLTRTVGTGVMVVAVAVVTWQQLRNRPVVSASTSGPRVMRQFPAEKPAEQERRKEITPATVPSPTGALSQPFPQAQIASAVPMAVASVPAISAPRSTASQSPAASQQPGPLSRKRQADLNVASAHLSVKVAELQGSQNDPNSLLRMKIAGPPQKLVYPVLSGQQHPWEGLSASGGGLRWQG
jgi:hypothetical protein